MCIFHFGILKALYYCGDFGNIPFLHKGRTLILKFAYRIQESNQRLCLSKQMLTVCLTLTPLCFIL